MADYLKYHDGCNAKAEVVASCLSPEKSEASFFRKKYGKDPGRATPHHEGVKRVKVNSYEKKEVAG